MRWSEHRELYRKPSSLAAVREPPCLEAAITNPFSCLFGGPQSHRGICGIFTLVFLFPLGSEWAETTEERAKPFSNRTTLRKLQWCFCILINRIFSLKAWKQTKWFICSAKLIADVRENLSLKLLSSWWRMQSKVTVVIAAVNSARHQFQGGDRGIEVTAETVGCSPDENVLCCIYTLQTKGRSATKPFPVGKRKCKAGLCVLDALCLSGFSFAYVGVFHSLSYVVLFLPLVCIMRFCPAVSEPRLSTPSQLAEENELPATTANVFKHHWQCSFTWRILC